MSDKAKSRLMIAGAALCAALFLFSGAMLAREYLDQKQSAEAFAEVADLVKEDVEPPTLELADDSAPEPEELTAFEKYADVYAQNSDLVGWITVPGTRIDYPVMQTKDNPNFYLKHAFDQSYSSYGVPYMQENCDIGISDNLVLYGHHMKNGSMFKDISRYKDQGYFDQHSEIILYTPEREIHLKALAAVCTSPDAIRRKTEFASGEEFASYIQQMTAGASASAPIEGTIVRLYSFVTCSYEFNNARTILYAYEAAE